MITKLSGWILVSAWQMPGYTNNISFQFFSLTQTLIWKKKISSSRDNSFMIVPTVDTDALHVHCTREVIYSAHTITETCLSCSILLIDALLFNCLSKQPSSSLSSRSRCIHSDCPTQCESVDMLSMHRPDPSLKAPRSFSSICFLNGRGGFSQAPWWWADRIRCLC